MSLSIGGMGWVTPLGSGIELVWQRLLAGEEASVEWLTSPLNDRRYPAYRVSADAIAGAPAHPRLRRSSAISRFLVVAGLAALDAAGVARDEQTAARIALIFAVSNGGVVYTKRFYHDVVESGAQAASPLLFPETVFNAPASHLAAILGITGASYTLVGDGAVGLLALKMAEDLMQDDAIDHCLVVGAEEVDWLLCDAYRRWRLLRDAPPIEPFHTPAKGMILSEGAGALLLSRAGFAKIEAIETGGNYARQAEAASLLDGIFASACNTGIDLVIASANGTFIDDAEREAARKNCAAAAIYTLKPAMGESVGAAGIWQVICAAQALRSGVLPPSIHCEGTPGNTPDLQAKRAFRTAVVSTCGLNQQAAALRLRATS